ncbi:MAG TPA: hypothetical protein VGS20_14930 [Candidatus Acidoferrales bacterium]|nr:hypothetical protein [Candidatus Acidoferrales bacterium]
MGLAAYAATPRGLVGVAQGAGAIQINGQPFEGQASLWSGDQILTGAGSPLTVISSPSERIRFEPGTSAEVTKQDASTLVNLANGAIEFQTAGATKTDLPNGIAVLPSGSAVTLAQVTRLANGGAQVAVYKGALEIVDADGAVTVGAGHTAVLNAAQNSGSDDQTDQNKKKKKKVWALFVTIGLSAGATAAIIANEPSRKESAIDP